MSPNHYLTTDENDVLGMYYSGEAPIYLFDDDFLFDSICDFPISPSVRDFIYEYIDENGNRDICYSFDGGTEHGIESAQEWIIEAGEAYIKLPSKDKILLNEKSKARLIKKEQTVCDQYTSARSLINKLKDFIRNESDSTNDEYNTEVHESVQSLITDKLHKYKSTKEKVRLDIQAEKDWKVELYTMDDDEKQGSDGSHIDEGSDECDDEDDEKETSSD